MRPGVGLQCSMKRTLALTLALLTVAPATAPARSPIRVAIGDQNVSMFDHPDFQRAKFKRVRFIVPWNVMDDAVLRENARAYVERARAAGISVLIHLSTDDYRIKRARLPSVATYRRQAGRIVTFFRGLGVTEFGAWNEVNHASQPTYKSPTRAAQFFT